MNVIRVDVLDTTPGSKGETCLFAPSEQVNTPERYLQALRSVVTRSAHHSQYAYYIVRIYGCRTPYALPRITGPFAQVLDGFFRELARETYGDRTGTAGNEKQKDGPPSGWSPPRTTEAVTASLF